MQYSGGLFCAVPLQKVWGCVMIEAEIDEN